MKKNLVLFITFAFVCSFFWTSCDTRSSGNTIASSHSYDSSLGFIIADTIIYDVIIKNRDTLDPWKEDCIDNLHKSTFIDSLFAAVYDGRHKAYDFFTNSEITPRKLTELEAQGEINRKDIGKVQFREAWYLRSKDMLIQKKVLSVILGAETYSYSGEFRDYTPVFRIDFP